MKRILVWLACVGLTVSCLEGCNPQTRVLVAGDSWAWIMQLAKTFENPFAYDVAYMAYMGDTAENWHLYREWQITDFLEANEDVDIVVLSLGGNDLMGRGNVHQTEEEKARYRFRNCRPPGGRNRYYVVREIRCEDCSHELRLSKLGRIVGLAW